MKVCKGQILVIMLKMKSLDKRSRQKMLYFRKRRKTTMMSIKEKIKLMLDFRKVKRIKLYYRRRTSKSMRSNCR